MPVSSTRRSVVRLTLNSSAPPPGISANGSDSSSRYCSVHISSRSYGAAVVASNTAYSSAGRQARRAREPSGEIPTR
ncbi:hypothetical protein WHI96_18800 [Pseudonocardia tropica]|uniref:Uncharacterized protein n=1 Tax=Pseudonocardia tropica TaxID=681289 RepID=A0ABV1JY19_9PSEU